MNARCLAAWAALGLLALAVTASCSSGDEKKREPSSGGDDAGGAGDSGSGGSVARAGTGGAAAGGTAGVAAAAATGGASEAGAGGGTEQVANAGQGGAVLVQGGAGGADVEQGGAGGVGASAGQGGAGGALCCDAGDYHANSNQLPQDVCSAWVLVDNADPEQPLLSGGLLRVSTSTNAENQYYTVQAPNLAWPSKLVVEARLRLISGSASTASRAPAFVGFVYGSTHQKNLLQIADGEIFLLTGENTKAVGAAVTTTDALHVYRVEVDTTAGTIEVFYDGQSKLTGVTFVDPSASTDYVSFGEGSNFATGASDWDYVTHNAYVCAE